MKSENLPQTNATEQQIGQGAEDAPRSAGPVSKVHRRCWSGRDRGSVCYLPTRGGKYVQGQKEGEDKDSLEPAQSQEGPRSLLSFPACGMPLGKRPLPKPASAARGPPGEIRAMVGAARVGRVGEGQTPRKNG